MNKLGERIAFSYYRTKFRILSTVSKKKTAEIALELFHTPQFRYKRIILPKIFDEAERLSFNLNGETVQGYRWNKDGYKRVLITHGFNSTISKYGDYIRQFIDKGYEVLAFDAPAHGRSTGKQINAVIYKEMILFINEHYGPIQSFMGHSFGGLALSLALEEIPHNENFRLVLIAPATESKTAIDFFFSFMKLNADVRKEFDQKIFSITNKQPEWYSVSRAVKNLKTKILWCHDESDRLTPWQDAKKVKEQNYPNINFVITNGLGHRGIYRDETITKRIVDFL
ncbi:MAG: alpha/beta fold hydrolase [Bacteroidetes bacterium]|nr:alpha/beta fold hydrolase [Bacteroidota bacterium]MBS1931815.1 alpha/beta fold hydrolase [Bacteroidota bacterium]